jgi:hypothetical protein
MGLFMYMVGGAIAALLTSFSGAPTWAVFLSFMLGGVSFHLDHIENKINDVKRGGR